MKQAWVLAAALSAWCGLAAAQPIAPPPPAVDPGSTPSAALPPPSPPVPAPAADGVSLAADTPVKIELVEAVSSKDRARGDKFAIRLARPIVVDGRTLAPAGSTGVGEVVYAERGGGGGAPGKLVLAARYIEVGGVRVHLKAFNLSAGGESDFREMQVASEFIGPMVFLINGHDVDYPIGTRANAKVAEAVVLPAGPPAAELAAAAAAASAAPPAPAPLPASSSAPAQESAK